MVSNKYLRFRVIAAAQFVGGIIGLVLFYMSGAEVTTMHLLLLSMISFAFWAGVELWRGKRRGLNLSIICQALQIPLLIGSALSYKYLIGPHFVVGYFPGQSPVFINILSEAFIYVNTSGIDFGFGINLLALAFLIVLMRTSESEYKDYCQEIGRRTSREDSEVDQ